MKAKRIIKWGCGTAVVILAAVCLLIVGLTYAAKYKIKEIDFSVSDDGQYRVIFQAVGEPDWPFGNSHARIVLKNGGRTVTKYPFDVANDGGILTAEQWRVDWKDNRAEIVICGEEQPDIFYIFFFDGTVTQEAVVKKTRVYGKL